MSPEQETELFTTLKRLDRNVQLAIRGLQLVCTELNIRKELAGILNEIDAETEKNSTDHDTLPAPAPAEQGVSNGE